MADYVLKFYRRNGDTPRQDGLKVPFVESDDQAAIDFVCLQYAAALEEAPFAILVDADERELWRKGTPIPRR